ncbi:plasmid recombination protein, partial [Staphylococcus aureus]|uniref:plasmid recombination protein n=1 Tax=Staphylococcus aureus TaxID=1280 RepID=UPI00289B8F9E
LQKHNQRENNNYNNKDIRHEDAHKNYDLIHEKNVDYNQLISDKIDSNYTGNRKIRKDAIRHVEGIITSDEKFFNRLSEEET